MDCGDGVTVNVCSSDEDCYDEDYEGPKLTTSNRPELFAYSETDPQSGIVKSNDESKILPNIRANQSFPVINLLHPQGYEILAKVHDSINSDVYTSDTTDSPSSKSTIGNKNSQDANVGFNQTALGQQLKIDFRDNVQNGRENGIHPITDTTQQLQHRESISCGIEESTEVLLINSADCNDKYFGLSRAYSATDSDVEVLMSEEIGESDWSAGDTATGEHTPENPNGDATRAMFITNHQKENKISNDIALIQEAYSQDEISIENSSPSNSLSTNEQLDKESLLKIIGEQAACIHKLKSVVEHYRRAFLTLYKHSEAIQYTINIAEEDLDKLGFPHRLRP